MIENNAQEMGLDELFALGELDAFLKKSEEKVAKKISGMKFAGMDADDVKQEALLKVYRSLDKYDSSKAKMSTFLDHIISNTIRDCLKKAGSGTNLRVVNAMSLNAYATDSMDGAEEMTLQVGTEDVGYTAFEVMTDLMENVGLTDREKEIFRLHASGYDFGEIAQVFKISRGRMSQIWSNITTKCQMAM
ncbi:sigma-70 family RNA polymerase sigma factor (plasmid) [Paenibacillus sp. S-38]|uniref:sigma-70 family RNA polymerase sigma factor n=1 Tax=Paenibacillus sp. S-38 TaxID=3416710 RepID=UPI003CECE7DD